MPDVWPEVAWVLEAFSDLSLDRAMGFGSIGYIPTTAMVAWAGAHEVEDVPCFLRHIRALDVVYVADQIERQKRDQDRRSDKRTPNRGDGEP